MVIALPNLRCGDFLSEKIFVLVLEVILSFGFSTRHYLSFHKFEKQSCLLWSIMHCLLVNGHWECLIFYFSFFFCGIMAFYVSISHAVFLITVFFPFLITVSG